MIKVLLLDLGESLVDAAHRPLPQAKDALAVIAGFNTASGKPIRSCLVADIPAGTPAHTPAHTPARTPRPSAADIEARFREVLEALEQAGLRALFEPVQKRVTLSAQAGAMKPPQPLFEAALHRLGSRARLDECLLLRGGQFDAEDWAQAPALMAHALGADSPANMREAVRFFLASRQIELHSADDIGADGQGPFTGSLWTPISVPGQAELGELHVPVPITGRIVLSKTGRLEAVGVRRPSAQELQEAASFVHSLAVHGQIAGHGSASVPMPPTHEIQTDEAGVRRLVRRGFSAI